MANAIQGAVILSEKNGQVNYQIKCDSCGTLGQKGCWTPPKMIPEVTHTTGSFCQNCKKNFKVAIAK